MQQGKVTLINAPQIFRFSVLDPLQLKAAGHATSRLVPFPFTFYPRWARGVHRKASKSMYVMCMCQAINKSRTILWMQTKLMPRTINEAYGPTATMSRLSLKETRQPTSEIVGGTRSAQFTGRYGAYICAHKTASRNKPHVCKMRPLFRMNSEGKKEEKR